MCYVKSVRISYPFDYKYVIFELIKMQISFYGHYKPDQQRIQISYIM
jgi:hypothetical protein